MRNRKIPQFFSLLLILTLAIFAAGGCGGGSGGESGFSGGSGTAENPWRIGTAAQLNNVRNHLKAYFILAADIDMSKYESWTPIGKFAGTAEDPDMPDPSVAFTGTFNGGGHTISNLKITDTATARGVGLFGCTAGSAVISDLTVKNAAVSAKAGNGVAAVVGMALQTNDAAIKNVALVGDNTISGISMVGGIVGGGYCGVESCTASADIVLLSGAGNSAGILAGGMSDMGTGCSIVSCDVTGGAISVGDGSGGSVSVVGGLAGCATDYKAIKNCSVDNVTITAPKGSVMIGGLVGAAGKITEGAMAADARSATLIEGCAVSGLTMKADGASRIGGIVGSGFYFSTEPYLSYYPVPAAMQIVNCSAGGTITGGEAVGSIAGYIYRNSSVTACRAAVAGLQQAGAADAERVLALDDMSGMIMSVSEKITRISAGKNQNKKEDVSTNKRSGNVPFAGGSGSAGDPWLVFNAEQLDAVRNDLTAHYQLTANIDLSENKSWTPIGKFAGTAEDPDMPDPSVAFTGTFNGGGHTISNLKITDTATARGVGLFGCTAGSAVISDLTVKNAAVSAKAGNGVAAVVGMALQTNDAAIKNVALVGDNTISGISMVGGIVGGGYCGVESCTASADIVLLSGAGNSAGILAGGMSDMGTGCSIVSCDVTGGAISVGDGSGGSVSVVGGLAGCATDYKAIKNCSVDNVTITAPKGSVMIGGLVGAAGKITEGAMAADARSATLIEGCAVSGLTMKADGASRIGGIVGSGFYFSTEPYLSYYPVPAAMQIVNCSAGGTITGGEAVGSIAGYIYRNSSVTACRGAITGLQPAGAAEAAQVIALEKCR